MEPIPATIQHQCLRWQHSPNWQQAPAVAEINARLTERLADIKLSANPTIIHLAATTRAHENPAWGHLIAPPDTAPNTADAIVANLVFSAVADVPRVLHQAVQLLKPDGVLLASLLGSGSFPQWQQAWAATGATTPHAGPFPTVQTAANLLQRLQLALPVVDRDLLTLTTPNMSKMLEHLRTHGVSNHHPERSKGLITPRQWQAMETAYNRLFATPEGRLPTTLEVIYLHAFKPAPGQPQSAKRGSGKVSLVRILSQP
jgi:NADH dehydrogenase [ubiquinone] 1 alpha subcomplex assembly factor 5